MSAEKSQNPKTYILTIDEVEDFHEGYGDKGLSGYSIATEEICFRLNAIMQNAPDFEDLKKELTEFVNDRQAFTTFIFNHKNDEGLGYTFQ